MAAIPFTVIVHGTLEQEESNIGTLLMKMKEFLNEIHAIPGCLVDKACASVHTGA